MFGMFKKEHGSAAHTTGRPPRHSRGWTEVRTYLHQGQSLRVLDFGSTSPANINYITTLGHSVYMANVVEEATKPEWLKPAQLFDSKDAKPEFDVDRFIASNLDFSGRDFDVILLWDTANFLPPEMVPALFNRLRKVLRPDGKLLAFFHARLTGPETVFSRFQLGDSDSLLAFDSGNFPVRQVYQTRQVEKLLEGYSSIRFFLGKDNVREVIATR
jgi:SAM-dependent methyltransferase